MNASQLPVRGILGTLSWVLFLVSSSPRKIGANPIMVVFSEFNLDIKAWNRKILNTYWIILLIIWVAQAWNLYHVYMNEPLTVNLYIQDTLIKNNLYLLIAMVLVEFLFRYMNNKFEYILILLGIYIASILFVFNNSWNLGVQIVFILPLLMSIYYFDTKKIFFAGISTLLICLILFPLVIEGTYQVIVTEIISTSVMVIGTCLFAFFVKVRGLGLIADLQATIENQQNLFIQNIVMDKMTKVDALTGLNNHKTYHEYIERLVDQAERNGLTLQLALIDIDNFKSVNDTFGHRVGDIVLKEVTKKIEDGISSEDIAFRYGGEEFAIIFTNKTVNESFQIVDQIRESISQIHFQTMAGQNVTISGGVSDYCTGSGKDLIFNNADSNLYKAKHDGKNKICSEGFGENV